MLGEEVRVLVVITFVARLGQFKNVLLKCWDGDANEEIQGSNYGVDFLICFLTARI